MDWARWLFRTLVCRGRHDWTLESVTYQSGAAHHYEQVFCPMCETRSTRRVRHANAKH